MPFSIAAIGRIMVTMRHTETVMEPSLSGLRLRGPTRGGENEKVLGFMGDGPLVGRIVESSQRSCFVEVQNQRTLDDLARGVAAPITRLIFDLKEGSVVWRLRR